jgi:hypothetical protein
MHQDILSKLIPPLLRSIFMLKLETSEEKKTTTKTSPPKNVLNVSQHRNLVISTMSSNMISDVTSEWSTMASCDKRCPCPVRLLKHHMRKVVQALLPIFLQDELYCWAVLTRRSKNLIDAYARITKYSSARDTTLVHDCVAMFLSIACISSKLVNDDHPLLSDLSRLCCLNRETVSEMEMVVIRYFHNTKTSLDVTLDVEQIDSYVNLLGFTRH